MEEMARERREWVNEYRANNQKIPDSLEDFHNRHNVETPTSPEDGEEKKDDDDGGGKKKKDKGKKEKKKKGKKGKKGGDDDGAAAIVKLGPSEVVLRFEEIYDAYNDTWNDRDETENYK